MAEGRKAAAVISGELHVPGLEEPVRVLRDRCGLSRRTIAPLRQHAQPRPARAANRV
jgi:hypothetical protein